MNQLEQKEAIGLILATEKERKQCRAHLLRTKNENPPEPPEAPLHQTVDRTYPEITPTTKFLSLKPLNLGPIIPFIVANVLSIPLSFIESDIATVILFLIALAAIAYIPFNFFKIYKPKRQAEIEAIAASPEYKAECARLDAEYDQQQAAFDAEYTQALAMFENDIQPAFKKRLAEWEKDHAERLKAAKDAFDNAVDRLTKLYDETKLVPARYQTIEALEHIYETMSSSEQYTVKDAIESYEKELQLKEMRRQNSLLDEQNRLQDEGNRIADEQVKATNRQTNVQIAQGAVDFLQRKKYHNETMDVLRRR